MKAGSYNTYSLELLVRDCAINNSSNTKRSRVNAGKEFISFHKLGLWVKASVSKNSSDSTWSRVKVNSYNTYPLISKDSV